jgi:hypothetical protein
LPDDLQRAIADLEHKAAYLFELAMLALRTPPPPSVEIPPLAPIFDDHGNRFLYLDAKIRAIINSAGRSSKKVRGILEILSRQDSLEYLIPALQQLGLPVDMIDDRLPASHELIAAMPIQGIFTELRIQTHLKKDWKGLPSDLLDFWTMATVMPFVDYFVTDKRTYNLAVDAHLGDRSSCRVVHRLPELCDLLRDRLGLSLT